ncbi:hypothetical protein IWQ57_002720 [Coemansia nantahalensis]|uniref:Uncharacterized protein n=1 Tax=Coemansia nantahalensis TaxID=2789366 RepID=A0ACC1JZL5_9FUNG|nr:hypothetical protein IWQ57_002720 [Coemansia nantahalensis]
MDAETGTVIHDSHSVTLTVKGDRLVKSGTKVHLQEAYNLEYVQGKVACPKLYGYHQKGDEVFIEMEHIKGKTLRNIWPTLDDEQQQRVADNIIREMRRLHEFSNGESRTCGITGGAIPDGLLGDMHFDDEKELNKYIGAKATYDDTIRALVRNLLPTNSRFCLSHGDLHSGNIMVKADMSVVFVDWATLGFLPEYWDAMKLFIIQNCGNTIPVAVAEQMYVDPKALAAHQLVVHTMF